MTPIIIAEAGVNHDGKLSQALALVDAAADAGAHLVKFQTFNPRNLVCRQAPRAAYQERNSDVDETQLEMLLRLELKPQDHFIVRGHCEKRKIGFLSSPFDLGSLNFLVDEIDVPTLKFGSGELTNGPLLLAAARSGRGIILSTGMATLDEVAQALDVIAFGYGHQGEPDAVSLSGCRLRHQAVLREKVSLLHCTTEYPAPIGESNLRAMHTLRDEFGLRVGFSDHTPGLTAAIAAVALGAEIIEKHLTLDRRLPGPDHRASMEPQDLAELVRATRDVSAALGDGIKKPAPSEVGNMAVARKSLAAATDIKAGQVFTPDNLTVKRPGTGISPNQYWQWLGRPANRDYEADEIIQP